MKLTIKTIRNIVLGQFVIVGLIACSSSPAPWTQVDDSPWGSKRKAEAESLSQDAKSMSDPVLLGEPEPVKIEDDMVKGTDMPEVTSVEAEVVAPVVTEPATVETVVVEPVIVETQATTEQELLALPASDFAVQVYAAKSTASVDKFKNAKDVQELRTVATYRSGSIMYVLVDIYPDLASAKAAAKELEARTGAKPWVRSMAGLQKIIVQ